MRYQNIGELAVDLAPIAGESAQASAFLVMKISGHRQLEHADRASADRTGEDADRHRGVRGRARRDCLRSVGAPDLALDTTLAGGFGRLADDAAGAPETKNRGGLIAVLGVVVVGGGAAAAIALTSER